MLMWSIYCSRIELLWEKKFNLGAQIIRRAQDYLLEQRKAKSKEVCNMLYSLIQQHQTSWPAPPIGGLKCKVDATLFDENHLFGFAACIHGDKGQFVQAMIGMQPFLQDVHEGEALALHNATKRLRNLGIKNITIETDYEHVVSSLCSKCYDLSKFRVIISQCRRLLIGLPNFLVVLLRETNLFAHCLARASEFQAGPYYYDNISSCFVDNFE